jgi:3-deoxy-D-manno-octulosonate 8-phosphate phosphatase KdsC-like HAD superfamily phosphatase
VTKLEPLLTGVRLAALDFDGVFTDNRVWVLSRPRGAGCVREFCGGVWEAQRA